MKKYQSTFADLFEVKPLWNEIFPKWINKCFNSLKVMNRLDPSDPCLWENVPKLKTCGFNQKIYLKKQKTRTVPAER